MSRLKNGSVIVFLSLGFVAACDGSDTVGTRCEMPLILESSVTPDNNNVLSALVSSQATGADSIAVRFGIAALDLSTPAHTTTNTLNAIPLLGLNAATQYRAQLIAFNSCGSTTGPEMSFTTGALPADLPSYRASGIAPAQGYVVFAAGNYGIVIDNTGRVVWYHRFTEGPGLNFQAQPNGRFAARPNAPSGQTPRWIEIDPLGDTTRTMTCARDLVPRLHDMIAQPDGSYWMLCDEVRVVDLSAYGRSAQSRVMGTGVQHRAANGEVLFDWSPFDHIEVDVSVLEASEFNGSAINWTHGNSIDLDSAGNLLVSFRNLNEVIRIDTRTGAVMWRLGGNRNQFTFENVSGMAFFHQHGVRSTGSGRLVLLDNLGERSNSRTEAYEVDEVKRTARLTSSYASVLGLIGQIGGSTQSLAGGHTLVSFGNGGGVEEYDAAGTPVWKLDGNPGYVFRAQRIKSLYKPGVGDPR